MASVANHFVPGLHLAPGAVALVAMAATFGAATRATFTAIVFAFELTQDYRAILPIMLAAVIADLVAGGLLDHGLMTEKLDRRGLHVPHSYEPDYLQTTRVRIAMTGAVETIAVDEPIADARVRMQRSHHNAYPLIDHDNRCVGIVTRRDLLDADAPAQLPASTIATTDNIVAVAADDTLLTALQRITEEHVDHLPVLDPDNKLIGICTRTDILRARSQHHDTGEQLQPGWHTIWRKKRVDDRPTDR